ncbi:hypothetical protein [Kiloniella majae]|uniref:hypothetical protein n=1 Tax=Kiloniella majae TaxID=1938558 RepID=UPI000A278111|nr:hypothetical protein [Kiloniella majae]
MLDQLYSQQIIPKGQVNPASQNGQNNSLGSASVTLASTEITQDSAGKSAEKHQFKNELAKTNTTEKRDWSVKEKTPEQRNPEKEEQSFGFFDFLDVINPLQHIPVISTLYREITGDEIQPAARVAGGMIFGGPTGFITAIANSVSEETTGKDIGENVLEAFLGSDEDEGPVHTAALETSSEGAPTALFSELAPVIPPAPIQQPKLENAVASHNPGSALEGKAAMAALYNDLARPTATESVQRPIKASTETPSIQQESSTSLPVSKPGKWFPLSGGNVLIAQTSHLPQTTPSQPTTSKTTNSVTSDRPSTEETIASIENGFAQNLLNGLDKYQQLKTNN